MTLQQLIAKFKETALAHEQIAAFHFGYLSDINTGLHSYPLAMLTPFKGEIDKVYMADERFKMEFYVFDKKQEDEDEQAVYSRVHIWGRQILQELFTKNLPDLLLDSVIQTEYAGYQHNDELWAVKLTFSIGICNELSEAVFTYN